MQNNFSFIVSGAIAIFIYLSICFFVLFYIMSPVPDTINMTPTSTSIELDMIVEKAEKKMVERKVDKIKNENPAASLDELKVIAAKKGVLLYYHV